MKRTKALRRRCDQPACGKLYRYSDPRSRTCSSSCRQRLCRSRKKAADQVAQEQVEAKLHGKYARMYGPYGPYSGGHGFPLSPARACTTHPHGPTSTHSNTRAACPWV